MPITLMMAVGNRIYNLEPHFKMIKYKHLFGPVMSRRLGISLGIDLVPYKYCPLNCVYCEVQKTTHQVTKRESYFEVREILDELDNFMATAPHLDYITFSGAGEPTLNSSIGEIVNYIKAKYPSYKLALLTNGVLFNDKEVRQEILPCDIVLPSLDSATQEGFEKINRPCPELKVQDLIEGLVQFRNEYKGTIWLEVFLIKGINDTEEEIEALAKAINRIKPNLVQLNCLDRPGAEDWVNPIPLHNLKQIKAQFKEKTSVPVEIIAKVKYKTTESQLDTELLEMLHSTLVRRPSTAEDLSAMLDIHINEISKVLRQLCLEKKITVKRESRGVFYIWTS
ncbi:MAG TPA: radical SAM protein [Candidatus Cloacimonas sp.]|jgi:wyosine [tRNA(Phe)-imidazoG37] synthetase (radical SAM superfamily)|nr:radical SAM protein [Candidatus Cloacimonas sp.]